MPEKKTKSTADHSGQTPQKFSLSKLKESCRELFGCSSIAFAGATCGLPAGEYTVDEINSIVIKWLKKEAN